MSHLADKGTKSKRFRVLVVLVLLVTIDYKFGAGGITPTEWLDFLKWAFAAWALSEVGKAGAEAYRDQGGGKNVP